MEFLKTNLHRFRSSTKAQGLLIVLIFGFMGVSYLLFTQAATPKFIVVGTGGKCLDNREGKVANNNPTILYKCNKDPNSQQWQYIKNTLRIKDHCLDVPGASKAPQKYVQLYKCNNTPAQVWIHRADGSLLNPNSGLCLDNKHAVVKDYNPIWTYKCNGTVAQIWKMNPLSSPAPTPVPPVSNPQPKPTPPTSNTTPLPFAMPSNAVLKASSKKVFAHYFTPYPIQFDNVNANSDYYARNYMTVNGESGKHAAYGGMLRDRPLPQPIGGKNWELENMKTEVRRATEAGLDGFTVDILSVSSSNWDRLKLLIKAANEVDKKFKIVLMPDGNSSAVKDSNALASAMAELAKEPSVYKLDDGRLVISPFKAESAETGAAWWKNWINTMKTKHGITVAFIPCFLNYQSNVAAFSPFSYGFSNWGNRNPAGNTQASLSSLINDAHARGKIWMQPVSVQDTRPNQGAFWEANNTENFRASWAGAISGADWVQIPTWNDYSEHAHIAPSTHTGWSLLDINAYYLTKYKTGAYPAITKDVIYVSHRIQKASAQPTTKYPKMQTIRGSNPARDKVEVLTFLKQAGTVQVSINGVTSSVAAPAGVSAHLFDLRTGTISAKIVVNNQTTAAVQSPFAVVANPPLQDLQYYFISSARSDNGMGNYSSSMTK